MEKICAILSPDFGQKYGGGGGQKKMPPPPQKKGPFLGGVTNFMYV